MKHTDILLSLALLAMTAVGFTGCSDQAQPPVIIPDVDGQIGTGVWDDPMQAWQAALGTTNNDETLNWVTGYIVGWINTDVSFSMNEKSVVFSSVCNTNTNLVMAQYPYDPEKWAELGYTWDDCASVQLPSGTVRNALNLMENPENFNQQVTVKGTTGSKYCSHYGIRSVIDFNWGNVGKYEQPEVPAEAATFVKATEVKDGHKYAFVHGQQVGIPVEPALSYGYIKVVDFFFATPDSFVATTDNAFLFTAEGDGFTIQDCYGKYYYLEGTYTSFQVDSQKPADNYIWKVAFDNGHFNITNTGKKNVIEWSANYTNFSTVVSGDYKNGGPELYEMTE
ncbi:MAG: hypothetical protein K2M03_07910 [Muribaculaceae bacterium]|nr:hypothetical protein [Muribaculaceae bacterium]